MFWVCKIKATRALGGVSILLDEIQRELVARTNADGDKTSARI